jgi:DNA-binding CsgD family transcriptional regulator
VIANNLCVDHMRATARTSPSDEVGNDSIEPAENAPEHALLRAEQRALIQRALADLPDRQRDVVVARDLDGRRPPEIAAALGLSLGAVDSLLLRARRRLAAAVQSMTADSGASNLMTTAAVSAVGGSATQMPIIGKVVQLVGNAVANASYHVASAVGMVPGMPSLAQQAAPLAAAGLAALAPGVGSSTHLPDVPHVPAIQANVPPASTPELVVPGTSVLDNAPAVTLPNVKNITPATDRGTVTTVTAPAVVEHPPTLLEQVGNTASNLTSTVSGLLGQQPAR